MRYASARTLIAYQCVLARLVFTHSRWIDNRADSAHWRIVDRFAEHRKMGRNAHVYVVYLLFCCWMRPVYSRYDACAAYHICGHLYRRFDNVVHDRRKRKEEEKSQTNIYLLIDFIAFTFFVRDYIIILFSSLFSLVDISFRRVTVWARRILDTNARTHKYDATRRNRQIREWTNQDAARRTFAHSKENLHKMDEFIFIEGNYHVTSRAHAHAYFFFSTFQ